MSDLGTRDICQVGIVVRDIERAAKAYAAVFGTDVPKVILTDTADRSHMKYHGQPSAARAKLAFFQMGAISLELIEPVGGPSTWQEFLDSHGEGVHHIAFQVKGRERIIRSLEARGMKVAQTGDYGTGCYTYIDSQPQLAVILELLESFEKKT